MDLFFVRQPVSLKPLSTPLARRHKTMHDNTQMNTSATSSAWCMRSLTRVYSSSGSLLSAWRLQDGFHHRLKSEYRPYALNQGTTSPALVHISRAPKAITNGCSDGRIHPGLCVAGWPRAFNQCMQKVTLSWSFPIIWPPRCRMSHIMRKLPAHRACARREHSARRQTSRCAWGAGKRGPPSPSCTPHRCPSRRRLRHQLPRRI